MDNQPSIRVVVVDDLPSVRASLSYYLSSLDDITVAGEAGGVAEALPLIDEACPDVVLMDLLMPGIDGIAGTRAVCQRFPQTRVLVLSVIVDATRERQLLEAGAAGYLTKHMAGADIAAAIRAASIADSR
jgi:DNA-binding NarL/FixJ family response regulator